PAVDARSRPVQGAGARSPRGVALSEFTDPARIGQAYGNEALHSLKSPTSKSPKPASQSAMCANAPAHAGDAAVVARTRTYTTERMLLTASAPGAPRWPR